MRVWICLLLIVMLPSAVLSQGKFRNRKEESSITYTMKHALHEWDGTSKEVNALMETDAAGEISKVAAVVKVSSFDSKNSNRDSHMLEITDALTYPNITFVSTAVKNLGGGKYLVKGDISFHGQKRPVEMTVTEEKKEDRRIFSSAFVLLLEDFKIERPSLMLVKTDNEMKMVLKMVF